MQTFKQRLQICADRVGGRAILARQAGISAMQFKRYIHGASSPTLDSLERIAIASGVKISWLVGGEDNTGKSRSQVVLDRDVFLQVVECVEVALTNYNRMFSAKRKAMVIFALTQEAEQADLARRKFLLSQKSIMEMFDFISFYPEDEDVEDVFQAINFLPQETDTKKVNRWVDKICRLHDHIYSTQSGKQYFDRLPEVAGDYGDELDWIVNKAEAMAGSVDSLLDVGCGNGRHLKYIHTHHPHVKVSGIDTADYAIQLAQHLELKEELPRGTFQRGDMRHLPFEKDAFNIVMSRFSLFCLPMSPTGEGGLHQAFYEVARVLKPGGMFYALTRKGQGLSFYTFAQLVEKEDVENLAQQSGLQLSGFRALDINHAMHQENPQNKIHSAVSECISFQLVKPLNWSK